MESDAAHSEGGESGQAFGEMAGVSKWRGIGRSWEAARAPQRMAAVTAPPAPPSTK